MDQSHIDRIEAARALVAAPLLVTLADNLEAGGQTDSANKVRESIRPEWQHTGEIVISDAALHPYIYHLRLSKVPARYHFDGLVPPGYEQAMRKNFAIFREAVRSFWTEWKENMATSGFLDRMLETETAFYWNSDDEYWVGIIGYCTDNDGRKYR